MARTTRSTTQHQEKDVVAPLPPRTKSTSKKRKRNPLQDSDEQPATKQLRTDQSVSIKDEQDTLDSHSSSTLSQLRNTGDVPIDPTEAQKILDILEMSDTQGLLDRVFPLPAEAPDSSPDSRQDSYSFRALLKESFRHPLCVLRTAVRHLLPISSYPRSRPSTPAAQQLHFCYLALSLLDQASYHSVPIPLHLKSILPPTSDPMSTPTASVEYNTKHPQSSPTTSPLPPKRKYALMQRLTAGNWWTSLQSDFSFPLTDGQELKDLPTGYAELVAIIPSPSTSLPSDQTLGSYQPKKSLGPKPKLPTHRRVSCGTFLDYGVWASFAPSFDQEAVEVGRTQLGEVLWGWEEKKERSRRKRAGGSERIVEVVDVNMDGEVHASEPREKEGVSVEVHAELGGLLPPSEVKAIKAALDTLELENAVQELLERNRRALERLEELQILRLTKEGGGLSEVEEGSEEWDTAQGIIDSLTLLASLRPRSSSQISEMSSLVPPPSILHRLHQMLPLAPSFGRYGSLPQTRSTALRDDSTLKVRSGVSVTTVVPSTITASTSSTTTPSTTIPSTVTAVPAPTTTAYGGYSYAYSTTPQQPVQQQYRPTASYAAYKPGQASAYYQGAYNPQQPVAQGQNGPQSYYATQSYGGGATGQQPYAYTNWYNYPSAVAGGTNSGRETPQPVAGVVATPATVPTTYGSFFGSATPPPGGAGVQRTPAVANTVLGSKTAYQGAGQPTGTWGTGSHAQTQSQAQVAPTLPAHLRSTSLQPVTAVSGTPPVTYQQPQPGFYGTFPQATTSAVRRD